MMKYLRFCAWLIFCSGGLAVATVQHLNDHVSWFVQLSDLHINKHVHHDIVPDLMHFGSHVVTKVKPGAILITGDLVDAKTKPEGSAQNEEEWQAYERVWRHLAAAANLNADAVLDLRGNHDAFNTLRNTGQDLFAVYSATAAAHGQAAAAAQRVWSYQLQPQLLLPPRHLQHQRHADHGSSSRDQPGRRRLSSQENSLSDVGSSSSSVGVRSSRAGGNTAFTGKLQGATLVRQRLLQHKHQQQAQQLSSLTSGDGVSFCPAAVLVGVDFTPNVGLHAPANFFGVATVELIAQVKQQLQHIRGSSSSGQTAGAGETREHDRRALTSATAAVSRGSSSSVVSCRESVPIISYSHYPFSTVATSYVASSSMRQQRQQQREGGRAVRDVLMRYDVSAHLSGHLHDLVGPRLHTMYHKQQQQQQQQQSGVERTTFLADLEAADWKQARRWRLVVLDSGVVSFADFKYKKVGHSDRRTTAGLEQEQQQEGSSSALATGGSSSSQDDYTVQSVDSSRNIQDHLVVITWPPDGRYSPLTAAAAAQQQQQWGWQQQQFADDTPLLLVLPVRALVIPMNSQEGNNNSSSSDIDDVDVRVRYSCNGRVLTQGSSSSSSSREQQMHVIGRPVSSDDSSSSSGDASSDVGPQVFGTRLRFDVEELKQQCDSSSSGSSSVVVQLQVMVTSGATGHVSTSDLRPVLLPFTGQQQQQQQRNNDNAAAAAAGDVVLPLGNGIFEHLIMLFDGPSFGYWLFYTGWWCQVGGLLLLPRLFGRIIMRTNATLWRTTTTAHDTNSSSSSSSSWSIMNNTQQQQQKAATYLARQISFDGNSSNSSSSRRSRKCTVLILLLLKTVTAAVALTFKLSFSLLRQLCRLLLLPFASMSVLCCHHGDVWWLMMAHAVMVQWGPWCTAQMSSSSGGLGLWFRYGLLLPLPGDLTPGWIGGDPLLPAAAAEAANAAASSSAQHYVWLPLPDTYLVSSLFMCLVLAPVTLWMGLVVSAWHGAAAARHVSSSGGGGGVIGSSSRADDAGDVEMVAAAAAADDERLEIRTQEASNSFSVVCNGSSGSSSSSRPTRTLSRTRSNTQARQRESMDLPVTAAAPGGFAQVGGSSSVSSNGVGESAVTCDERASLLPAAAAGAAAVMPTAAAAAALGGVSSTGSAWLINLLPLGLLPGAAAAAAVASPTKKGKGAAAAAGSSRKGQLRLLTLLPTMLCYLLGLLVLLLQMFGRLLQSLLVSTKLPAHLLVLLLPIVMLWYKCCWRFAAAYGPVSLLLSPVVGWLPLFVGAGLRRMRQQIDEVKAHRQE